MRMNRRKAVLESLWEDGGMSMVGWNIKIFLGCCGAANIRSNCDANEHS